MTLDELCDKLERRKASVRRRGLSMNPIHDRVYLALSRFWRGKTHTRSSAKRGNLNPAFTHGQSRDDKRTGTGAYRSWLAMKARCTKPYHPAYERYSKLGICDEWKWSFETFYEAMGDRPTGYTLDRIDPDVGYFPGNVRWLPWGENSKRARRTKPNAEARSKMSEGSKRRWSRDA